LIAKGGEQAPFGGFQELLQATGDVVLGEELLDVVADAVERNGGDEPQTLALASVPGTGLQTDLNRLEPADHDVAPASLNFQF